MLSPFNPNQNRLLAALPEAEFKRLSPHLKLAPMPLGDLHYESDGKLQHVYFPTSSIVSLHYVTKDGTSAEIAGVGKEGMLGISLFMGDKSAPTRASVSTPGFGYKMKAQALMEEFNRAGSMQRLLLRYTQALITKTSQTALCNRHHSVAQQLCRWLLVTIDRVQSHELFLSQEQVAGMIGVCREDLSAAFRELQQAELIGYRQGCIAVLNRAGLEEYACECYCVVKKEFDRLFGLDWDWRPMPESVMTWTRASSSICAQM